MRKIKDIPLASDVVSAEEAIYQINELIESGHLNAYTQICLIRAMGALNREKERTKSEEGLAEVRNRCGDD